MSTGTVYVVHQPMIRGPGKNRIAKYDLTKAKRFGKIIEVFIGYEAKAEPMPIIERMSKTLNTFSDEDSLLCLGDPMLLVIAGLVLENRCPAWTAIRILRWDKHRGDYTISFIPRIPPNGVDTDK